MDELEMLKRAKVYMDKLANGIDPISETEFPDDTILNNIRLSRCFFYVADVLRQVIDKGGITSQTNRKSFYITEEQKHSVKLPGPKCYMKDIVDKINEVISINNCKKLQYKSVNSWLISKGFLEEYVDNTNKNRKKATALGNDIGIRTEIRTSIYGSYPATFFNENAQNFILDNIDAITSEIITNNTLEETQFQGKPWSSEHEEMLIDLYKKQVSVYEIAVTLKRSEEGIRARLKKLGLIENRLDV